MKYRTLIELICDAANREDALHTVGEYLRGEVESGVDMRFRTIMLVTHKIQKYGVMGLLVMFFLSTIFLGVATKEKNKNLRHISSLISGNTYTIQPVLKTTCKNGFKKAWEKKKDEAILEYIKK
ncbi:MAG: hypothetical protein WBB86_08365 [Candidatus Omnitrophota bacterium]